MKKESGFTLIEVVVTLILVGIMASVAGLGIVTAVKGYLFAKNNTVIAGKAQVALARMTRELTDLRNIDPLTNAQAHSIVFDKALDTTVAIGQVGTEIKIGTTLANGDVLVDQVTPAVELRGLSFDYRKGSDPWTSSDDIALLSHIVITLTMSGAGEGSDFIFSTTVNPRNNGNAGGTPPPATPPPAAGGGGCFVATAAYGNPYHPMVLLLKQFRDQYLATWPGGRALIQFYYKEGPYLAEMIHDKPWASGLARVLLLPFVGLSFLLVYAKGSIPLVILIIIACTWLIKRYPRRSIFMKKSMAIHNEKGSVLIGLIVTMVIMAFLGAALVSLTSTSGLNQAYGSLSQKAYYLAEAGFAYAGSEFKNVVDVNSPLNGKNDEQNSKANDLNGRTLTMAEGSIKLNVTPFHYAASAAAAAGINTLSVVFPGGTPSGFAIPSTGSIQIKTQTWDSATSRYITSYTDTYTYTTGCDLVTGCTGSTAVTFTLPSPGLLRAVPAWKSVAVIAHPSSNPPDIIPNTNPALTNNRLTLTKPTAGFFMPERNGKFMIQYNQVVYKYDYRVDGTSTTTLYGVSNSKTPTDHTSFNVTTASVIIPNDFFTIASTGAAGNVSRTITYITPIDTIASPNVSGQKTTSADPFTAGVNPGAAGSNWYAATAGTYSVATSVSGGSKTGDTTGVAALRLTDSYNYGGTGCGGGNDMYFSLIALKWGQDYANFYASWLSHAQTLSYDAQVKMKLPQQDYYMAGMMFRLNLGTTDINGVSGLGVAFLRGSDATQDEDGIETGVVPVANVPVIVLWQKNTGGGLSSMQWIAYKIISGTIFFNDGNSSLVNGQIDCYIRGGSSSGPRARVASVITTDGGVTGSLDVSSLYSTFTANEELLQFIKQPTTTTARVTSVSSTSIGFDRGRTGIVAGDIIRGRSSNANAIVTAVTQTGGDWNGSTNNSRARGTISITQLQGTFTINESLDVYRPNASHSAHFVSYTAPGNTLTTGTEYIKEWSTLLLRIEEKLADSAPFNGQYVNDIKIYIGDTETHGTQAQMGSPLDALTYANQRWSNPPATGDVQWPPDAGWKPIPPATDISAENISKDHFTLVQGWVINPAFASTFALRPATAEEPYSTIRTNTFTTHGLSSFVQQEIGLQSAAAGMDNNTYFDDFGVQMEGGVTGSDNGFSTPLQY